MKILLSIVGVALLSDCSCHIPSVLIVVENHLSCIDIVPFAYYSTIPIACPGVSTYKLLIGLFLVS
jgi:hypothetical protein